MKNAGLEEAQAGIKITGRNINNLRYADNTTFMVESEEEPKIFLKVKNECEKVGLNSTFRKLRSWHLVPSLHANRWANNGNSEILYFWGAPRSLQMVTAAMKLQDACSFEEKL